MFSVFFFHTNTFMDMCPKLTNMVDVSHGSRDAFIIRQFHPRALSAVQSLNSSKFLVGYGIDSYANP